VASRDTLTHLFERIYHFLQRLKHYIGMPLTEEITELLGKVVVQLLSLLAFSTKMMADKGISESIHSISTLLADSGSEIFMKRLLGRTDVEDALLRLDHLTKEDGLMIGARNLAVMHHADSVIRDVDGRHKIIRKLTEDIDGNIHVTKTLTEDVGQKMNAIEGIARNMDANAKASKRCTQPPLSLFVHLLTPFISLSFQIGCQNSNGRHSKFVVPRWCHR